MYTLITDNVHKSKDGLHFPRWYFTKVQAPWNSTGEFIHSNTTVPSRGALLLMPSYTGGNRHRSEPVSGRIWTEPIWQRLMLPAPTLSQRTHSRLRPPWESKCNPNRLHITRTPRLSQRSTSSAQCCRRKVSRKLPRPCTVHAGKGKFWETKKMYHVMWFICSYILHPTPCLEESKLFDRYVFSC